jgi:DNA-binding CsgD family transcriptional regulator/PAS domain-containing protein
MIMRGLDTEIFSSVTSDIYDCALHPENWVKALTHISQLMDTAYATIALGDIKDNRPVMMAHSPWDVNQLRILNEEFGAEGVPGLREVIHGELDQPRSTLHQISEDEFQRSRFYTDWAKPQGLRDACVAKFAQTGTRLGLFAAITYANRDIISAEERRFLQLLSPHLRRAAMISDMLDQAHISTKLYQTALSALVTPIILTDKTGRIVFANLHAERLLAQETIIKTVKGVVSGASLLGNKALEDSIARAAASDQSLGIRGIGIPLGRDRGNPVIAYILPLTEGTKRGLYENAAVAIFLSSGDAASLPQASVLATLFDLTPMEAKVMASLGGGMDRTEAAISLGLSENTVKTHLSRIFTKTETSRQTDLVRLMHAISSPVD